MAKQMSVVNHDGAIVMERKKKQKFQLKKNIDRFIIFEICRYLPIMQRCRGVEVKLPSDDGPMKTYLMLAMNDDVDNGLLETMSAKVRLLCKDVLIECVA